MKIQMCKCTFVDTTFLTPLKKKFNQLLRYDKDMPSFSKLPRAGVENGSATYTMQHMMSQHCNNKLPSREDVTGVIVKGGTMAKITNGDKFRVAISPFCKSTVFTRLGFHISVWLYIAA